MSAEIVGPVPVVHFQSGFRRPGTTVIYDVPKNSMDPRYLQCTDHHVACDCREAELAEQVNELRSEYHAMRDAFEQVLAGHNVGDSYEPEGCCSCTGCQIARITHQFVASAWWPPVVPF